MAYSGALDEIVSGPKQPRGVLVYQTHRGGVNHHGQRGELRLLANAAQYVETGFLGEAQVEEDGRGQRMPATLGERMVAREVIYGWGAVRRNVDPIRQARTREGNANERMNRLLQFCNLPPARVVHSVDAGKPSFNESSAGKLLVQVCGGADG
jgi:hypothetical protein